MNILIPIGGEGSRFRNAGYKTPKPFLPLGRKYMIEQVIENLSPPSKSSLEDLIFLLYHPDHASYMEEIESSRVNVICIPETGPRQGAGYACAKYARQFIDNDTPLVIGNSDQWVDYDYHKWKKFMEEYDGGMMTFWADDPKWSYAKVQGDRVVEVAEKVVISENANTGIHYWKKGSDFIKSVDKMIKKDIRVNGELYVTPSYNELVNEKKIGIFKVDGMYGLGTPKDYEENRPLVEDLLQTQSMS